MVSAWLVDCDRVHGCVGMQHASEEHVLNEYGDFPDYAEALKKYGYVADRRIPQLIESQLLVASADAESACPWRELLETSEWVALLQF